MPKNLGQVSEDLSLPTKKYVDDAISGKAPISSPSLTGTPTAPTATVGTNSTQIATTAFVQGAVPDVSEFVTVSDDGGISDVVPTTFDGHVSSEFVLKTDVKDNLSSDSANTPLSANQGKVLSGLISTNTTNIASNTTNILANAQNIQTNTTNITANTSSIAGKVSKSGDTMTGVLVAQSNTLYTTKQVRNIFLSTSAPTSSDGDNGDIWIVYTP